MKIQNVLQKLQTLPAVKPANTLEGDLVLPADTGRPIRIGLWTLGIGFGGFLLWAALAPLDEGVPTQGTVAIDTKRKAVQHQIGGIVREVNVREGQTVANGQVLMRLDEANARANYESIRQHYLGVRAMEGRLMAEQAGAAKIVFHPDLLQNAADPLIGQHIANQQQIFNSRRQALQAETQAIGETIQGLEGSLQGYSGLLQSRKGQQAMFQDELKGLRDMVQEGYAPRNKQWELERLTAESTGSIADLQGRIVSTQRSIGELKMRVIQRRQEYRKEVDTQLADVRREVQADAEKFKASSQELERTEIRAPAAGQVVGISVQSVGAVIQPSQKLMDIVPADQQLLLETRVPPHLIDRIHAGLVTDVRFSTFAHTPQLVVQGKIVSISGDLLAEPQQAPYYLARVAITPEGLKELGKNELQAGMPVEVIIKTGERSMLTYLLHPLVKRMASSMKEE